jgi:hypothetical protein
MALDAVHTNGQEEDLPLKPLRRRRTTLVILLCEKAVLAVSRTVGESEGMEANALSSST